MQAVRKNVHVIISVVLAVVLCAWLARYLDTQKFVDTLMGAKIEWFLLAVALKSVYQLFRGLRIRLFFPKKETPVKQVWGLVCVQGFLTNLLPSWLGEAAMIYLLKRFHGMGFYSGAVSVATTRVADLSFILVMLMVFAALAMDKAAFPVFFIALGVLALIVTVVGGMLFALRYGAGKQPEGKMARAFHEQSVKLGQAVNTVRGEKNLLVKLIILTTLMWIVQYFVLLAVIRALGYDLSMFVILGVYVMSFAENLLPIKGVADLGTYEAVWYVALRIFGMDKATAVLLGFSSHALMFSLMVILAIPGFLILALGGKVDDKSKTDGEKA